MTNDSSEEEIRKVGVPEENIKAADEGNKGVADGWVTDPALLEHIVNGYLGGVGQTAGRLGHIFSMIGDAPIGEILGSDKMPVVRRLHYSPTDQNRLARTRNRWGHYMDELDAFETKMKNYKEQGAVDPWQKFKQISLEDSIRATRAEQMKDSLKMYNKLNKIQKNAANDSIRAAAKARIEQLMENTVRGLDAIGG